MPDNIAEDTYENVVNILLTMDLLKLQDLRMRIIGADNYFVPEHPDVPVYA